MVPVMASATIPTTPPPWMVGTTTPTTTMTAPGGGGGDVLPKGPFRAFCRAWAPVRVNHLEAVQAKVGTVLRTDWNGRLWRATAGNHASAWDVDFRVYCGCNTCMKDQPNAKGDARKDAWWPGWAAVNVGGRMETVYVTVGTELWSGYNGKMWKIIAGKEMDWIAIEDKPLLPKTNVLRKKPATAKKPMAKVTNNKPKAKVMKGRKTKTAKKLAARKTPVIKAITKKPATKVTKTPATKR